MRLLPLLALAGLLLNSSAAEETQPAPVDLREVLRIGPGGPAFEFTRLSPEWVGIIRTEGREPKHLRLTHVSRGKANAEPSAQIKVYRMTSKSVRTTYDRARYQAILPNVEEIRTAQNLAQLEGWFGPQVGLSEGWGGPNGMHWVQTWSCFAPATNGDLRWLQVFATVSTNRPGPKDPALVRVEKIEISEGLLRPADSSSAEEKALYKSGDQLQADEEARKEAQRARLPQPLRALVAARQTPDDHALVAYTAALSQIRRKPDPALFRQIAALQTGDSRYYLKDILIDAHLKVEPWDPGRRVEALRQVLEALPKVSNAEELHGQVGVLLEAVGGGHIVIETPQIDLKFERTPNNGTRLTQSKWDVNERNLDAASEALAAWFAARL